MPWFFVDDAFADSKPVMALDRTLRNEAIGLWVRCGAWSAKEETDGRVGLDTVKQFGGTPRLIKALHEQAGLWVESSPESWRNSREILFGNWEKWQKTKAETEARRKREAEKKSTWRAGKKGRDYVPASGDSDSSTGDSVVDSDESGEDVSTGDTWGESRYPDPTRPDPTLSSVETLSGGVTSVDARGPRPHCKKHPNENATEACAACGRRREWDKAREADQLEQQRQKRIRDAQRLKDCPECDDDGWRLDDYSVKCRAHLREVS